ncbi:hypothetical protein DL766_010636 [Monosporascus sp. MC13-8B]|uniref:Uncharacterized protein n=1 Tax=Monosporascus cannonballus TaxID=155416 RepID=A0ABY0GQA1_9PEZI|nr:hypothetical protein DL762_010636 [Monosporascus cannonballus]RYO98045.1 hypothetical protein DL763_002476 [Monosporascus cannonballus]RYP01913.1 hypothetical protein DL766_010636 [Monosporascus sp. MC13-8B]
MLVPTTTQSGIIPHTLHARHRQFADPFELEQLVTFREPHRVRYTNENGVVILDQHIDVKYEFSSVESSFRFQGDLRRKDLVDCFDIDVVWTDAQGRTDTFGNVRGIGTVQRLKMWTDQYSSAHSLTIFANRSEGRYREYSVDQFEGEVKTRDDRRRSLRLIARGRCGSALEGRRLSLSSAFRSRHRSTGGTSSPATGGIPLDIHYLGVQFSRDDDTWMMAHTSDSEFRGVAYPHERFELPSPEMRPGASHELPASEIYPTETRTVPEAPDVNDENIIL